MSGSRTDDIIFNHYYDILYATLLRDIGILFWRADEASQNTSFNNINDRPYLKWSKEFYENHLKGVIFEEIQDDIILTLLSHTFSEDLTQININSISGIELMNLAKIIKRLEEIIAGEASLAEDNFGQISILKSIISFVRLHEDFEKKVYYPLKPLKSDEDSRNALFPRDTIEEAYLDRKNPRVIYEDLSTQFINELEQIKEKLNKITFTTLFSLIFKYTLNVPSPFSDEISLFNYLKTSVSIAACLYLDVMNEFEGNLEAFSGDSISDPEKNRFLLLEGNISGIQKFIYSIASKGAAKGLKGRSFFVQFFGEIISRFLLEELKLPLSCEIYCDGGNFYQIIPASFVDRLIELVLFIKTEIYKVFDGDLFIDIKWIPFNSSFFSIKSEEGHDFGELWSNINKIVGREKFQRFNSIFDLNEGYNLIFSPKESGGEFENRVCSICKQEKPVRGDPGKCDLCESFEDLTRRIRTSKYMIIATLIPSARAPLIKNIYDFSKIFNRELRFANDKNELNQILNRINQNNDIYKKIDIFLINYTNIGIFTHQVDFTGIIPSISYYFLSNVIPADKDFQQIAEKTEAIGVAKIGYLRMDIDNLGSIFSHGLKPCSFSRLSDLSLRFKLFFKFWINNICKGDIILEDILDIDYLKSLCKVSINEEKSIEQFLQEFKTRINNNIYLLYSNGDDLFIIGHWNDIIIISVIIQEVFNKFVSGNPNLTISGGLLVVHPKFPLYQAASLAGAAEERAKSLPNKNSIDVLGEAHNWKIFKKLSLIKELLYHFTELKPLLKKAFIHKLLNFSYLYQKVYNDSLFSLKTKDIAHVTNKNKINLYYNIDNDYEKTAHEAAFYSEWYWRFVYYIKRTREKIKNRELNTALQNLEDDITKNKKIKDLYMPVRWVELLTKKN